MSTIYHSDYCPEDNGGELEDCESCLKREAEQMAYWGALYAREHHYTKEDLRDCYSDPTDSHKLISMLGEEL